MGISTHILDTAKGRPAAGVTVELFVQRESVWERVSGATTNEDGRIASLLPEAFELAPGLFRVWFDTGAYYETEQIEGLYPFVEITFRVLEGQKHYHIPLLLTANGYTTYRGS